MLPSRSITQHTLQLRQHTGNFVPGQPAGNATLVGRAVDAFQSRQIHIQDGAMQQAAPQAVFGIEGTSRHGQMHMGMELQAA